MEACRNGDLLLPTYLLGNGADANEGGFPRRGPLFYAVVFEQPLDVMVKMLERGAIVTNAVVNAAIGKQKYKVIELLLQRGGLKDLKEAIESAHKTGNKEIIALVQEQGGKQREDVHRGKRGKTTRAKKGWWWFCQSEKFPTSYHQNYCIAQSTIKASEYGSPDHFLGGLLAY